MPLHESFEYHENSILALSRQISGYRAMVELFDARTAPQVYKTT